MVKPPPPPPPRNEGSDNRFQDPRWSRLLLWLAMFAVLALFFLPSISPSNSGDEISYDQFLAQVENKGVAEAEYDNLNGEITGFYKATAEELAADETALGEPFTSKGPLELSDADRVILGSDPEFKLTFDTPQSSIWASLLPLLLPIGLLIAFFVWMQRRAQGQIGGIMSIRPVQGQDLHHRAPGHHVDVAGYAGVKQEITEVVEFLKQPDKYAEIGARIPKGMLLVGPPGTGKTLIARAVAGEAGVPFLSVSGSDFMEMFVGVGASRVRDLFESARKMGKAIIFIDEIDSIGRKRGAGLGGGHDEREQTLNQMLIASPWPVRPPGGCCASCPSSKTARRFLRVHVKGKRTAPDVDLNVVARGTPGMSGADLANLVNEAALFAVRAGDTMIRGSHFESARDRILMGQKRESTALSESEKEAIAYHEAGHAVCAAVLPAADPLHKVTIIPSGMALGVTMQLPEAERHIYRQDYIEDSLVVRMGGRVAEQLVFGQVSTGANDDLVRNTELARKMVREWGMSDKVGPMAWGSNGEVFMGDQLVSTKDYSEQMAHVIDAEVSDILHNAERRCHEVLTTHRYGLDLVARALLERETIAGDEVNRLLATAQNPGAQGGVQDSIAAASAVVPNNAAQLTDTPPSV
ncbi:ATP-dependent zinc metalloprotease FtsH [Nymphon striatum]|nr:ATP-dependent zinc metalloprotease FtsH [Nymphon striatum]KAG1649266.1 ATP-dependent zinc metalloprotease FtsH [Nymphon striatum]